MCGMRPLSVKKLNTSVRPCGLLIELFCFYAMLVIVTGKPPTSSTISTVTVVPTRSYARFQPVKLSYYTILLMLMYHTTTVSTRGDINAFKVKRLVHPESVKT